MLSPGSIDVSVAMLLELDTALHQAGFKTVLATFSGVGTVPTRLAASSDERGVRVTAWCRAKTPGLVVAFKLRTAKGGWREVRRFALPESESIESAVALLKRAHADDCSSILPPMRTFNPLRHKIDAVRIHGRHELRASRHSQIRCCYVMGVAAVDAVGAVSMAAAREPNADCWFLLDCEHFQNATFNLLSDGQGFLAVERILKPDATTRIVRKYTKSSVELEKLDASDQELVVAAIQAWVERFNAK